MMESVSAPQRRHEKSVENCGRLIVEMVRGCVFELESTERINAILGHSEKREAPKHLRPFLVPDGRKTALVLVPSVRESVKFAEYVSGRMASMQPDERAAFEISLKYLSKNG